MSANRSTAVMQRRFEPRDSLDYFPTPAWATRALCQYLDVIEDASLHQLRCWEPACGEGHMARPLAESFETVFASDIHGYGYGQQLDFLSHYEGPQWNWIVTNPPFRLAAEFAHTAIERATHGVALLVRTAFLEGIERYQNLFSVKKPHAILQFTERVSIVKGRVDKTASSATAFCWIVWRCRPWKPDAGSVPAMVWIPPCRRKLERAGDYEETA